MTELRQTTLTVYMTLNDKVELCHSRIPQMRHITGFLDSNLIAPLPVWSPVPKEHQRTAQDSFSIWGLEAQHPKYLPAILQPFVRFETRGKGPNKHMCLVLLEGSLNRALKRGMNEQPNSNDTPRLRGLTLPSRRVLWTRRQ